MQPPPPRYKIFERDGRLITIDTWADKATSARPTSAMRPDRGATGARLQAMLLAIALPILSTLLPLLNAISLAISAMLHPFALAVETVFHSVALAFAPLFILTHTLDC